MLHMGDYLRLVVFALSMCALLHAVSIVVRRWFDQTRLHLHCLLVLLITVYYITVVASCLLWLRWFSFAPLFSILGGTGLAVMLAARRGRWAACRFGLSQLSETLQSLSALQISMLAIALAALVYQCYEGLQNVPVDGDSIYYHLPLSVAMLQTHGLPAPGVEVWFFPSIAELLAACLLLPTHSDLLVNLFQLVPFCMLICAGYALSRLAGAAPRVAFLVAYLLWALPITQSLMHSQEVDMLFGAAAVTSLIFLLLWLQNQRPSMAVSSGMAAGLVLGTKYSWPYYFVVLAAVAVVGVCSRHCPLDSVRPRALWTRVVVPALGWLLAAVVGGGIWYFRNLSYGGTPLYPFPIRILGHDLFRPFWKEPSAPNLSLTDSMLLGHLTEPKIYRLLAQAVVLYGHPLILVGLSVATVVCVARLLRGLRQDTPVSAAAFIQAAISVAFLGFALCLLATPFSVETVKGTLNQLSNGRNVMRYGVATIVTAMAIALPLIYGAVVKSLDRVLPKRKGTQGNEDLAFAVLGALLLVTLRTVTLRLPGSMFLLAALAVFGLATQIRWPIQFRFPSSAKTATSLLLVSLLCALTLQHASLLRETGRNTQYSDMFKSVASTGLYDWLERSAPPDAPSELLVASNFRIYPLYGRHFERHVAMINQEQLKLLTRTDPIRSAYVIFTRDTSDPADPVYGTYPSWMGEFARAHQQVYQDGLVSVFRL